MTVESATTGLAAAEMAQPPAKKEKLFGRAFYESIGSPKVIMAPMVDQSEFAWRMLSRSFMLEDSKPPMFAYTPMIHARLFADTPKYRESSFQPTKATLPDPPLAVGEEYTPHLDGNPTMDRPLTVQFCANDPEKLLAAAKLVQPYCDAVDLNLGCPQGIAKKGNYGAFLQESPDLIFEMINTLHENLDIPVTAKMRVLDTREKTLKYAKTILSAGASILTVHGRQRHQKGHNTGLADWEMIKFLRESLPPETVLFANGNILQYDDIQACLDATGADGVMSAEGNLQDPALFAPPPAAGDEGREYWRGRDGRGGWRMDAVLRRYMDIIYTHVLQTTAPDRKPLYIAGDPSEELAVAPAMNGQETDGDAEAEGEEDGGEPPRKKQKKEKKKEKREKNKFHTNDPNLTGMQAHLFQMLRPLVSKHTHIRDALARSRAGDIAAFENVLQLVEKVTREGIIEYEKEQASNGHANGEQEIKTSSEDTSKDDFRTVSKAAVERCRRPFWVCQPYIRPLPEEAIAKGAMMMSKKEKKKLEEGAANGTAIGDAATEGKTEAVNDAVTKEEVEVPKEPIVCG